MLAGDTPGGQTGSEAGPGVPWASLGATATV
jgi:hypothetical protein